MSYVTTASQIQGAIDAADEGDVVRLAPGTYALTTPIDMKSGVTLRGYGDSTILQQETTTSDVVIDFTATERAALEWIKLLGPTDEDQYGGIRVDDAIETRIVNCTINRFNRTGLGYGVVVIGDSLGTYIVNCSFTQNRHHVSIGGTDTPRNTIVAHCTMTDSDNAALDSHAPGDGIWFMYNRISDSNTSSGDGIAVSGTNFHIVGNTIDDTVRHGILISPDNPLDRVVGEIRGNVGTNIGSGATGRGIMILFDNSAMDPNGTAQIKLENNQMSGASMADHYFFRDGRISGDPYRTLAYCPNLTIN